MSLVFLPLTSLGCYEERTATRELESSTRRKSRSLTSLSLFLFFPYPSFPRSIGSEVYIRVTGTTIRGSSDYTCAALRLDAPWYRATISPYFYFISIPAYVLFLAARNGQPIFRWQSVVMMVIGSAGESLSLFTNERTKLTRVRLLPSQVSAPTTSVDESLLDDLTSHLPLGASSWACWVGFTGGSRGVQRSSLS